LFSAAACSTLKEFSVSAETSMSNSNVYRILS